MLVRRPENPRWPLSRCFLPDVRGVRRGGKPQQPFVGWFSRSQCRVRAGFNRDVLRGHAIEAQGTT